MKVTTTRGFSLVEVLIVIAILAVVLAIAAPNFSRYRQNTNLREATRALEADIALYKQKAASENTHYRIVLNQGANSYSIQRATTTTPGPEDYADLAPPVTKSLSAISNQVTISNITFSGTPPRIYIQPRGTIIPSGSVTLVNGIGYTGKITTNLTGRMYVKFEQT